MHPLSIVKANAKPITWLKAKLTRRWVLVMVGFGIFWWLNTLRDPVELNYCRKSINFGTPQYKCLESKILRIPRIYYSGYPIDYSDHLASGWQELEVAYPSMQPWHSVPLWQRWSTQKIEIVINGVTGQTVRDVFATYFLGHPKPSHVPDSLYGLDQYLEEPWHGYQYLLPLEANPRVFIHCAYNGDLAYEQTFGCTDTTYTPWSLKLTLYHKRILLSQWADIHAKVQALIQSFVVTP